MNYLQLVNRARRECSASGPDLATLGGVISQQNQRCKDWVTTAWNDIQTSRRDWDFMQRPFSFVTVPGQQSYKASLAPASIPDFANWRRDTLRAYRTSVGFGDEQVLPFVGWMHFRDLYQFGSNRTLQQRPTIFTVDYAKNLLLGATPDDAYTINGTYFASPDALVGDTDTPALDEEFHMYIVYKAMESYGYYEGAPEVLQRGQVEGHKMWVKLVTDYTPKLTYGATLA